MKTPLSRKWPIGASRGFTLIELLVAVTIIGLLIVLGMSGFKTAVAASRRSVCQQRLHQLSTGFAGYAAENENQLPIGNYFDGKGTYSTWDKDITPYMIGSSAYTDKERLQMTKLITCPGDNVPHTQYNPSRYSRSYSMIRAKVSNGLPNGVAWVIASGPKPQGFRYFSISDPAQTFLLTELPAAQSQGDDQDSCVWGNAVSVVDTPAQQLQTPLRRKLHDSHFNYLYVDGHIECLKPEDTIGKGSMETPGGAWTRQSDD